MVKKIITLTVLLVLLILITINTSVKAAANQLRYYIQDTRDSYEEMVKTTEVKVEWVAVVPKPVEDGILAKDAFNNDGRKIAFLTFDDGPSDTVTPSILDILKKYEIKATFFITGSMAENNGDLVKRAFSEGHTIANHSYSHRYSYSSVADFMGEVSSCANVLKGILGEKYETKIFRFPGGSFGSSNSSLKAALSENGYAYINWNASTGDSEGHNIPASHLLANLRDTTYDEDVVVLMHDLGTKYTTVEALPSVIEYLKSQGYEFMRLK